MRASAWVVVTFSEHNSDRSLNLFMEFSLVSARTFFFWLIPEIPEKMECLREERSSSKLGEIQSITPSFLKRA
jgi:hypothetical protein